jgi:hypothetical protein
LIISKDYEKKGLGDTSHKEVSLKSFISCITVGYDEFVGKLNISEATTMKSLYEQFGGIRSIQLDVYMRFI